LRIVILNTAGTEPTVRLAERIEEQLLERGCDVFVDNETSLTLEWGRALETEIRQADVVVAFLSPTSAQNEMFAYGLELARQGARRRDRAPRLACVRVQFTGELPPRLAPALGAGPTLHWAGRQDDERLTDELVATLDLGRQPASPG
jgi:hypothetical protein